MLSRITPDWRVAILALVFASLVHGLMLRDADYDPFVFAALGEDDVQTTAHVLDVLGDDEIRTRPSVGHDGRFFLVQAWDPLYLNGEHAPFLDRPTYRAQRMFYPLVIGLGGAVPKALVPTSMVVVGILTLAWGSLGTARLAMKHDKPALLGLAFCFNLGSLSEVSIGGAGVLAFALAIWATVSLEERRIGRAAGLFMLSVLTREVMLLYVGGVALLELVRTRRPPFALVWPTVLGVGAWSIYIRLRLDSGSGLDEVQELGRPFVGVIEASQTWRAGLPSDQLLMAVVGLCLVLFALYVPRDRTPLTWGTAGFLVLAPLLTEQVWREAFDISRAVLPIFTALIVAVAPASPGPAPSASTPPDQNEAVGGDGPTGGEAAEPEAGRRGDPARTKRRRSMAARS